MANWDAESGAFMYNLNGAMLTAPAPYSITATTYDYRRLPTAITRAGTTTQYRYSSDGQRYFKKTGSSAGEHYVLDGAVTMGLFTEAGALTHWNVVANGSVIGRREASGAKRFYVKDHLGSTRMVVTDAGAVVETSDHYPFGLTMPGRGYVTGMPAKEKFTGKERDVESGLDYFGARYYMPVIGRWGSVDPLASISPGWTPYNYAFNNPLTFVDPTGESPCDMDGDGTLEECMGEIVVEAKREPGAMRATFAVLPVAISLSQADTPIPGPADAVAVGVLGTALIVDAVLGLHRWLASSEEENGKERSDDDSFDGVDMKDTNTWPAPPADGPFHEGDPSRAKPRSRGEKSLYDSKGGEWRPNPPDQYHPTGHWNYKPAYPNAPWTNVPHK